MSEQVDLHVIPAVFEHAQRVYNKMLEESEEDSDGLTVYQGHLTRLFKDLRLSVPYYTLIKNKLVAMGCIEQTRRGGGNGTSRWVLWREPMLPAWNVADAARARKGNKTLQLEVRITDLTRRMALLEQTVKRMQEAM
jgi:hypothetical protein